MEKYKTKSTERKYNIGRVLKKSLLVTGLAVLMTASGCSVGYTKQDIQRERLEYEHKVDDSRRLGQSPYQSRQIRILRIPLH